MPEAAWQNGHGWRGKADKHKTSMLQDIEIGRAIEIDALVGAVIERDKLTQTPTPHIDSVYACVKLLAWTLGRGKPG